MKDGTVIVECFFEDWATGSTTDWPKLEFANGAWPEFWVRDGDNLTPFFGETIRTFEFSLPTLPSFEGKKWSDGMWDFGAGNITPIWPETSTLSDKPQEKAEDPDVMDITRKMFR
jgi:hypothetical protein